MRIKREQSGPEILETLSRQIILSKILSVQRAFTTIRNYRTLDFQSYEHCIFAFVYPCSQTVFALHYGELASISVLLKNRQFSTRSIMHACNSSVAKLFKQISNQYCSCRMMLAAISMGRNIRHVYFCASTFTLLRRILLGSWLFVRSKMSIQFYPTHKIFYSGRLVVIKSH